MTSALIERRYKWPIRFFHTFITSEDAEILPPTLLDAAPEKGAIVGKQDDYGQR
jgi:hypothetical protein